MKIPSGILAFLITGAVFGIIIGIAVAFGNNSSDGSSDNSSNEEETDNQASETEPLDINEITQEGDWSQGEETAPVVIVEFSEFKCPYCASFNKTTLPQIKKDYIDTGKVRFVFRHFPIASHENSQKASEATEAAGAQGLFWEMLDELYLNQDQISDSLFITAAEKIGVPDIEKFKSDLESGAFTDEVNSDQSAGKEIGVNATPYFFINGRAFRGAQPYSEFKKIIEEELAK